MTTMLFLLMVLLVATSFCTFCTASVFEQSGKWTIRNGGYTVIRVCVVNGSTANQPLPWPYTGNNPTIGQVLGRVRIALWNSYEKHSSIRFIDWRWCNDLSATDRQASIRLYIHPDADNNSFIGTAITTVNNPISTQFKPWGNDRKCFRVTGLFRGVFDFDCVEQYAIHEFGHAIGFVHEMDKHPDPEHRACLGSNYEPNAIYATPGKPNSNAKYIVSNREYDVDSIQAYHDGDLSYCDDTTGVRFGSPTLSHHDLALLVAIYPPPDNRFVVAMPSKQKVLDVSRWGDCGVGSNVQVWDYNGAGGQVFQLKSIQDSDGYIISNQIVLNHCDGTLALDAKDDACNDNTNIQVVSAWNVGAQYWNPFPDGTIQSTACNKALDARDDNNVVMWSKNGAANQQWKLWLYQEPFFKSSVPSHEYFIINPTSGRVLDYGGAGGNGCQAGHPLKVHEFNGSDRQRFRFTSNGSYSRLIPYDCPNLSVEVAWANCHNGATIQMMNINSNAAQTVLPQPDGAIRMNMASCPKNMVMQINSSGRVVLGENNSAFVTQKWELVWAWK